MHIIRELEAYFVNNLGIFTPKYKEVNFQVNF